MVKLFPLHLKLPFTTLYVSSFYFLIFFYFIFAVIALFLKVLYKFNFSCAQGKKVLVTNSDVYTLSSMKRADSGEYKCSLINNENMQASANITVTCKHAIFCSSSPAFLHLTYNSVHLAHSSQ